MTAVIKFDDQNFNLAVEKLRYCFYKDAEGNLFPVRALPYMTELKGENLPKIQEQNIFVKNLPKGDFHSSKLEGEFSKFGEILSCKSAINDKYESLGYGMVCFRDRESV